MLKVASHFHSLGFGINAAQDYITIPIESDNLKVILVHVDFRRVYREEIFSDMPAGWTYLIFPAAEPPFCRIALMEHTSAFSIIPDYKEVKHIITELDLWVRLVESESRDAVYRLAGWL